VFFVHFGIQQCLAFCLVRYSIQFWIQSCSAFRPVRYSVQFGIQYNLALEISAWSSIQHTLNRHSRIWHLVQFGIRGFGIKFNSSFRILMFSPCRQAVPLLDKEFDIQSHLGFRISAFRIWHSGIQHNDLQHLVGEPFLLWKPWNRETFYPQLYREHWLGELCKKQKKCGEMEVGNFWSSTLGKMCIN
jgi:hypothetical protein